MDPSSSVSPLLPRIMLLMTNTAQGTAMMSPCTPTRCSAT